MLLGIVIPVYNEKEGITDTLKAINNAVRTPHRIYIVYDFDEDDTLPVAQKLQEDGVNLVLVKNTGKGVFSAIRTGLRQAEEDLLLVTMADMSDDYRVVDAMCSLMDQGYDMVCGSRYMKGGRQIGGPLLKKLMSRTAGLTLRYIIGLPTHDATNSFKLYRKSMVDSMELEGEGGFEIGLELVVKGYFAGYKITEIPCTWHDRTKGASKFKLVKWTPGYLRWYMAAFTQFVARRFSKKPQ